MHHEAQVGLVEAHAQCRGRHERLDPVGLKIVLRLLPVGVLRTARVRGDRVPALAQIGRDLVGRGNRQGVDDPRTGELVEVIGEPGQPMGRVRQPDHCQTQALPVQRPAQHQGVRAAPVPSCSATSAVTRAFAVAVVARTGTPDGRSASIVRNLR